MVTIHFYRTTGTGQVLSGTATWNEAAKKLDFTGEGELAEILLEEVNREDPQAVQKALATAPERFDGGYLRAKVLESGSKYGRFVTIDDRVVFIGGPGSGAGGVSAGSPTGKLPAAEYVEGASNPAPPMKYADDAYKEYKRNWTARDQASRVLEEQTGVGELSRELLIEWAGSSNGATASAIAQQEAAKMFGTGLSEYQKELFVWVGGGHPEQRAETRKLLNAMYENTQRELAKAGVPETVTLLRGVSGSPPGRVGDIVNVYSNALSSFTSHEDVTKGFIPLASAGKPGYVIEIQVPRSRILSTARTGLGTLSEFEFVILGNNTGAGDQVKIVGTYGVEE